MTRNESAPTANFRDSLLRFSALNQFCATGEGGGIDPSCGSSGRKGTGGHDITAFHVTSAHDSIRQEGFKTGKGNGVGGDGSHVYTSEDENYSKKLAEHLNKVREVLKSSDDPVPDALEYVGLPYESVLDGGLVRWMLDRHSKKLGRPLTPVEEASAIAFGGRLSSFPETPAKFGDDLSRFLASPDAVVVKVRGRNPVRKSKGMGGEIVFREGDVVLETN